MRRGMYAVAGGAIFLCGDQRSNESAKRAGFAVVEI